MLGLDIDNQKKNVNDGTKDDDDSGKGDIFYDALGCLPKQKKNDDIAVEDVSDEEDDDEIRGLNSTQRNLTPIKGDSWLEPLDYSPSKKNQEPCGKSFSTFTPVKPEPNGTSFSTYSPEPAIEQETKGWGILNMFSAFSASKPESKKQQEP